MADENRAKEALSGVVINSQEPVLPSNLTAEGTTGQTAMAGQQPNQGPGQNKAAGTKHGDGTQDFTLAEAGGPGEVTPTAALPERIQQGITDRYQVTDRKLDSEGEEGYPTPT